jgi:hypothetical protein
MTHFELVREVAQATGESLREIRRRGFSLAVPENADFDPEPNEFPPQSVNWDQLDSERISLLPGRHPHAVAALVQA